MGSASRRGWAFRRENARPVRLPVAEETTVRVRWQGGGFSVHGSPWDLDAFAVGHLVAEGYVTAMEAIRSVTVDPLEDGAMEVHVDLARPLRVRGTRKDNLLLGEDSRPAARASGTSGGSVRPRDLLALAESLRKDEREMRSAGPLHWAVLYDASNGTGLRASDISRHSAVDKVIGKALLARQPVAGRILHSTGRVGEEMTAKAIRMGVAALTTRSVPFRGAAELANREGLLLVGKLRPGGFCVYAGRSRLGRVRGR